jgi:hypothetical protein
MNQLSKTNEYENVVKDIITVEFAIQSELGKTTSSKIKIITVPYKYICNEKYVQQLCEKNNEKTCEFIILADFIPFKFLELMRKYHSELRRNLPFELLYQRKINIELDKRIKIENAEHCILSIHINSGRPDIKKKFMSCFEKCKLFKNEKFIPKEIVNKYQFDNIINDTLVIKNLQTCKNCDECKECEDYKIQTKTDKKCTPPPPIYKHTEETKINDNILKDYTLTKCLLCDKLKINPI